MKPKIPPRQAFGKKEIKALLNVIKYYSKKKLILAIMENLKKSCVNYLLK